MMRGYKQNQAESRRETNAAMREALRQVTEARQWYSTWRNRFPPWVGTDLETIESKLKRILEETDEGEAEVASDVEVFAIRNENDFEGLTG